VLTSNKMYYSEETSNTEEEEEEEEENGARKEVKNIIVSCWEIIFIHWTFYLMFFVSRAFE